MPLDASVLQNEDLINPSLPDVHDTLGSSCSISVVATHLKAVSQNRMQQSLVPTGSTYSMLQGMSGAQSIAQLGKELNPTPTADDNVSALAEQVPALRARLDEKHLGQQNANKPGHRFSCPASIHLGESSDVAPSCTPCRKFGYEPSPVLDLHGALHVAVTAASIGHHVPRWEMCVGDAV